MRRVGLLFIAVGLIGVLLSAVTVSRPREVVRIGSVSVNVQEDRRPLLPTWIGAAVLVAGVVLGAAGRRRGMGNGSASLSSLQSPGNVDVGRGQVPQRTDAAAQTPN